jgi:hypothetical protein
LQQNLTFNSCERTYVAYCHHRVPGESQKLENASFSPEQEHKHKIEYARLCALAGIPVGGLCFVNWILSQLANTVSFVF